MKLTRCSMAEDLSGWAPRTPPLTTSLSSVTLNVGASTSSAGGAGRPSASFPEGPRLGLTVLGIGDAAAASASS